MCSLSLSLYFLSKERKLNEDKKTKNKKRIFKNLEDKNLQKFA